MYIIRHYNIISHRSHIISDEAARALSERFSALHVGLPLDYISHYAPRATCRFSTLPLQSTYAMRSKARFLSTDIPYVPATTCLILFISRLRWACLIPSWYRVAAYFTRWMVLLLLPVFLRLLVISRNIAGHAFAVTSLSRRILFAIASTLLAYMLRH